MRRAGGYAVITEGDGGRREADTFSCSHCQRIVFVRARQDPSELGGFCRACMRHICGPCADVGSCTPFEKMLERVEARDRFLRSAGL
jgi:hypothetical protein